MSATLSAQSRMHRSALIYAGWGLRVFPLHSVQSGACSCGRPQCGNAGKHPRVRTGFKEATLDPEQIAEWWTQWPDANIGIATGQASGIIVIDVDPRNGGEYSYDALVEEIGAMPETARVQTGGGGWHQWFRWPAGVDRLKPRPLGPGIDIKADGGYVVAPPSRHQSGKLYDWEASSRYEDVGLADLPRALLERMMLRSVSSVSAASSATPAQSFDPGGEAARDAARTLLGRAFAHAQMLGAPLSDGKYAVVCPWQQRHTTGEAGDSGTAIFPAKPGATLGGFRCLHSHCANRTWQDVLRDLPADAVARAKSELPMAPSPVAVSVRPVAADADGVVARSHWHELLVRSKDGNLISCVTNAQLILRETPEWQAALAYDEFRDCIVKRAAAPWTDDAQRGNAEHAIGDWTDSDTARLAIWFHRTWGLRIGAATLLEAAQVAAEARPFHPVREYLSALRWDRIPRVGEWLHRYLGAEANDYTEDAGRCFLVSAVARVLRPGCKVDTMLVLEGSQGAGKSTALAALFGADWVNDSTIDLQSKDRFTALRGKWALEFAELDALGKADIDRVKAFLSSPKDTFRPPYGRQEKTVPRQCVFAGTTNREDYLRDETGGRRFLPVRVGRVDVAAIKADRDQLWAEAAELFRAGAEWWPSEYVAHLYAREQSARRVVDAWEQPIANWLQNREECTVGDVMSDALNIERGRWAPADQQRVSRILRAFGWSQRRSQLGADRIRRWHRPA